MLDNLRKLQHRCNVVNSKAGGKWKVCPESLSSEGITACIPNTPNTAQMHGLWISIYCPIGQRSDCLCWLEPILHGPPLGKFLIQSLGQEQLIVLRSLSQYFQASCEEKASNTSRISQKDSRNLHYICKMWPLGSTAPKKPSKLLTCAAGRRISNTGTNSIKNMEMNGQSEGSASSSQFPVTFLIPVTKISHKYHRKRGIILTHISGNGGHRHSKEQWRQYHIFWWEPVAWFVTTKNAGLVFKGSTPQWHISTRSFDPQGQRHPLGILGSSTWACWEHLTS